MKVKFRFSSAAWEHNNTRLTNQIFKLLPMYENEEDWRKQQETILLELKGYNDILESSPDFMILIAKVAALAYVEDKFNFRKLIFEAITALKDIKL
jgi:hypothetical protein